MSWVFGEIRVCLLVTLRRFARLVLVALSRLRTAGGAPPGHILGEGLALLLECVRLAVMSVRSCCSVMLTKWFLFDPS